MRSQLKLPASNSWDTHFVVGQRTSGFSLLTLHEVDFKLSTCFGRVRLLVLLVGEIDSRWLCGKGRYQIRFTSASMDRTRFVSLTLSLRFSLGAELVLIADACLDPNWRHRCNIGNMSALLFQSRFTYKTTYLIDQAELSSRGRVVLDLVTSRTDHDHVNFRDAVSIMKDGLILPGLL
jgi:hypothetical protein